MENKIGKVVSALNSQLQVSGYGTDNTNVPIVSIGAIDYVPKVGEIALFTPVGDNFGYLGSIKSHSGLKEGEVKISCGNAYIYLRQNGTVIINGLMITENGKVIEG